MGENYFDILGVGRDADDETVKQAFRELAKACHPDRNPGDASAEQQFKRINTAYEALKDGHRREAYGEWLQFAETRERSKMAQWGRIGALIAVLILGPVLLYLALMSSDLASPGGEQATQPQTSGGSVAAPANPPATTPQKQAAPQQAEGTHITPAPVPVTEATKTPRNDPPVKNTPPENTGRSDRWEPAAENVSPVTTESLQHNQSATAAPATPAMPTPGKTLSANDTPPVHSSTLTAPGSGDALPDPDQLAPSGRSTGPSIVNTAPPPISNAGSTGNTGNFADCDHCPPMVVTNDPRGGTAKDRNGRPLPREPMAVSKEITVSQWNACVAEGSCPRYVTGAQGESQRVVRDVSARDAAVYADWLSRKTGQPYRVLADSERNNQRRDGYTETTCATPGWEWLEDGCSRRSSSYSGFRVMRSLRTATD